MSMTSDQLRTALGDLNGQRDVRIVFDRADNCFIKNALSGSQDLYLFQGTYSASNDLVVTAGTTVMVKFDGRSRINSAGIAILINLVIDSREQGFKVYLIGMSDHFRKIF